MTNKELARACAAEMYRHDKASKSLGIEIEVNTPGTAIAQMTVTGQMVNGFDVCHGGLVFTLADTAFAFACNGADNTTVAAGASIEFLRPARRGDALIATARERQRGKRSGVYDVEVVNQENQLVAVFRGRASALDKPILKT